MNSIRDNDRQVVEISGFGVESFGQQQVPLLHVDGERVVVISR